LADSAVRREKMEVHAIEPQGEAKNESIGRDSETLMDDCPLTESQTWGDWPELLNNIFGDDGLGWVNPGE
jgi:hypothetical protein